MKVCPVCKSTLFDDMDVCYGCMYRFGGALDRSEGEEGALCAEKTSRAERPSSDFLVKVEVRDRSDKRRVWSMELVPRAGWEAGSDDDCGQNGEGAPLRSAPSRGDNENDPFADVD